MQNRNPLLFYLLSDKDKLSIRLVHQSSKKWLATSVSGPYQTKTDFIIAVDGVFMNKASFNQAWHLYHTTSKSTSNKPAMLYKLAEYEHIDCTGVLDAFAQGEDLIRTGRIYNPIYVHTWNVNRAWVLSRVHKKESAFCIFSSNLDDMVWNSKHNNDTYSAFASEVALIWKVGYRVTTIKKVHGNVSIVLLQPTTSHQERCQLNMTDLLLTKDEIVNALDHFEQHTSPKNQRAKL